MTAILLIFFLSPTTTRRMTIQSKETKKMTITRFITELHDLIDKVIVVIGPRGTGKSTIIKNGILYNMRDIPLGQVYNGTEEETDFYSEFVPSIFVDSDCDNKSLEKFKTRQKLLKQKKLHDPQFKNVDNRAFIVIDDCIFDDAWLKTKIMRYFFMNGRHVSITLIIASQYAMGVPKALRGCIDYVFICAHSSNADRKTLFDNYSAGFNTLKEFSKVLDQCTQNYSCLVIKRNSTSRKLSDQVWWYRAPVNIDFKMCHPIIWKYHGEEYDKKYRIRNAIREKNTKKHIEDNLEISIAR